MRHHLLPALIALTLFLADQLLKAYFATAVRIPIVEPHFYLSNFRNTEPTTYPPMVHALGMIICLALILYLTRRWRSRAFVWGFWFQLKVDLHTVQLGLCEVAGLPAVRFLGLGGMDSLGGVYPY